VWNPGDGSDTVEGGAGTDTMLFNGANISESIDISANGERVRFFRDVGNVTMDLNDVEHIHFSALGGADTIVVNDLSGTDATQVDIDLAGVAGSNVGDGQQDQVNVMGSAGNDAITVAQNGDSVIVHGLSAEVTIEHAEAGDQLAINGLGGEDTIDASGLAAGHIGVQLNGGDGADTLIGSAGNDLVNGGRGNDTALLGAGDDTFVWNPGDGSDTVEGGAGTDTMLFNGANISESIDISANGERVRFFRDVGNITMDLNGVEHIDFHALGGQDNINVHDLSGTEVKQVAIDLAGPGGNGGDAQVDSVLIEGSAGNDVISLSLRNGALVVSGLAEEVVIENFDPTDAIRIDGLGGDDVIDASALGAGAPLLTLAGGEGDDVLVGGAGNDTLQGDAGDDVLLGGAGSDVLDGGSGNNVLIQDSATVGPNATLALSDVEGVGTDIFQHGQVTIEDFQGGAGGDEIDLHGVPGATTSASAFADAQDAGGNVSLDFGQGEQTTLDHVDVASLPADNLLL
jgi:Ca2+-binding RTX toxin-like protein